MTEHLTKRTIDYVDQDVSKYNSEDGCRAKKVKWDTDETPKQQNDEDRNNSNGLVKVKVTVSDFTEPLKDEVRDSTPHRIVVNEKCKKRDFDDEAQKASNILKNIVLEKMNDKLADEAPFQRVQQHEFQPMVPLPYSRPPMPVHHFPSQRGFYPPFVRPNFATFGNLTSLPRVGIPRMVDQSGKIMIHSIPSAPPVTVRTLPPTNNSTIHGPATSFLHTSTSAGAAVKAAGTITINDQACGLPNSEYFSKISNPTIKSTTVQVMPGTCMTYKTPGASFKNRHGKVKRPMNAFMVWARNYRSRLSEEMPQASNAQISVRLGQIWGSMSLAEKEKYFREAERIKLQHNRDFPGWVYQPKQKKVQSETQHDRLWARFGPNSSKDPPKEVSNSSSQGGPVTTNHQIINPTPVTVYPKTPIVNTTNVSITSPLPSFSQLTQTVSDPTPILSLETGRHPTPVSLATTECKKSGPGSEPIDRSLESTERPTAFRVVTSNQPSAFTVQLSSKKEPEPTSSHLTSSSTTGSSPMKVTPSLTTSTGSSTNGSVRSFCGTVTGCPSPKGRPPSISRRISLSGTPAMLISTQRPYKEVELTKNSISESPNKTKSKIPAGLITTASISDQRQQPKVTPLMSVSDVRLSGSRRPPKSSDPVDELWPFPLPTVVHNPHVDVLYDDNLRYERESGPEYIDHYNPFYYDGSYDDTRSGLQIDVNSWQKYLNYTKMQNETEEKTNLSTCFPPPSSSSVWCNQTSNNVDHYPSQATNHKQSGSLSGPHRTSSESSFASSLTSAINVLDDNGGPLTPDSYSDVNITGCHQNKISQRNVLDLQRQTLQALDLSSGTRTQTSVSNIVYLGQATTHLGSGDGVKSLTVGGSPPDKLEDSRPLKKRTERYRQDFLNGRPCVTPVDIPTEAYLEDVVFLTSPERGSGGEGLSGNLQHQASDCIDTGSNRGLATSPKLVIDVGHDFVKSLKSGTVITDLIPANLTNSKSMELTPNSTVDPGANQIHNDVTTDPTGNADQSLDTRPRTDVEPCVVNIKRELVDDQ